MMDCDYCIVEPASKEYWDEQIKNKKEQTLLEAVAEAKEKFKLEHEIEEVLDDISKMFRQKNNQYRTNNDDLANFTKGALMLGYEPNEIGRFEALKGYVLKHISKVYNGTLNEDKMDESILDIAVYFVIATVMHRRMERANESQNRE